MTRSPNAQVLSEGLDTRRAEIAGLRASWGLVFGAGSPKPSHRACRPPLALTNARAPRIMSSGHPREREGVVPRLNSRWSHPADKRQQRKRLGGSSCGGALPGHVRQHPQRVFSHRAHSLLTSKRHQSSLLRNLEVCGLTTTITPLSFGRARLYPTHYIAVIKSAPSRLPTHDEILQRQKEAFHVAWRRDRRLRPATLCPGLVRDHSRVVGMRHGPLHGDVRHRLDPGSARASSARPS